MKLRWTQKYRTSRIFLLMSSLKKAKEEEKWKVWEITRFLRYSLGQEFGKSVVHSKGRVINNQYKKRGKHVLKSQKFTVRKAKNEHKWKVSYLWTFRSFFCERTGACASICERTRTKELRILLVSVQEGMLSFVSVQERILLFVSVQELIILFVSVQELMLLFVSVHKLMLLLWAFRS